MNFLPIVVVARAVTIAAAAAAIIAAVAMIGGAESKGRIGGNFLQSGLRLNMRINRF